MLAQDRARGDLVRAFQITDDTARYTRLAALYDREARWWQILARYVDPYGPYLLAVIRAHTVALRTMTTYQDQAHCCPRRLPVVDGAS